MKTTNWTKLFGSDEITKVDGLLLHVAGSRGQWFYMVTERGGKVGGCTEGEGIKTKNEAKGLAVEAARKYLAAKACA